MLLLLMLLLLLLLLNFWVLICFVNLFFGFHFCFYRLSYMKLTAQNIIAKIYNNKLLIFFNIFFWGFSEMKFYKNVVL